MDMGFQPHADGGYDFVYDWGREATVEESLTFADRVQAALQGQKTFFPDRVDRGVNSAARRSPTS